MTTKLMHVITSFGESGTTAGLHTLVNGGFYNNFDARIVGLVQGAGSGYEDLKSKLGREHITTLITKPQRLPSASDLPRVAYMLHKEFSQYKPDVTVLSLAYATFVGRVVADLHPEMKLVTFEHNAKHWSPVITGLLRMTSGKNPVAFGDTPETMDFAAREYYRNPVTSYEVPLKVAEPHAPREPEQPASFNLLSLGRLEGQKNYIKLLKAVSILRREGRDLNLTIAGEGSLRPQLESLRTELGIADRVHLPGFVKDINALHDKAHIYVQPSNYEGQCLGVVEAMIAGVPTVATNVGGMRDYGFDGVNMVKTKGFEPEQIAGALRHLMDNYGQIAAPMSKSAIATMQEHFGDQPVQLKWSLAADAITKVASVPPSRSAVFMNRLITRAHLKPSRS